MNNNEKIEISDEHSSQWVFNFLWTLNALGNSLIAAKLRQLLIQASIILFLAFKIFAHSVKFIYFHPMKQFPLSNKQAVQMKRGLTDHELDGENNHTLIP